MTAETFPVSLPLVRPALSRSPSRPGLPGLKAVLAAAPAGSLLSRGPRGLVGLLLGQSARARRAARPLAFVSVSCKTPAGKPAVRIALP